MYKIIKIILLLLLVIAVLFNSSWFKSLYLGIPLVLLYFIIFGFLLGRIIFSAIGGSASGGKDKEFSPQGPLRGWQIILGIFSLLSAYSLLGAIIYYFYQLNQLSVSILLTVISIAILILDFNTFQNSEFRIQNLFSNLIKPHLTSSNLINLIKSKSIILTITYLILFAIAIYTLFISQTTEAIRSPWQVIPKAFFIIYFLATLNLILLLFTKKNPLSSLLISLHFFLTTSVAFIIYKLGYGFDPFVHQVTELAIFKNGFILPKPFYYLGQYSIVVILAHLFQISVEWLDKLLLPVLLSVFLPFIIYKSLAKTFDWQKNLTQILCLSFLLLPFGLFIATTPQALANLYAIIILFLSLLYLKDKPGLGLSGPKSDLSVSKPGQDRQIPFWYLILLTLCTLAIHALSGIPILIYLIILWLVKNKNYTTRIILIIFTLLSVFALPLALLLNSIISIYKITIATPQNFFIQLPNMFARQYWYFLDLAYLYKNSIYLIFLIITLLTLYNLVKHHKTQLFLASILTFAILTINAILLSFINVSFIINYEQGDFSSRIFQLSFYFLLPIVIYGLYLLLEKTLAKPFIYKSFVILILSLFLSLSLYLSYPRFDDYENSKLIIVLANQMESIAALKTFGFSKYYAGQYFYPIPTGARLYSYFEKMIYQSATKQTVEEAMDYTGVKTAYFVLPTYWSHFVDISAQAKNEADGIYTVDDKIWVFKYFK
ncbi:MAG: hypothetical protein NTX00_02485 [Candidatus Parcubacteria bacterium]|nr:hypothetical protein [Candidatus Parcubacteria bacterium]